MPVIRDVHQFLLSLETQLRQQQIRVCRFLSSIVLFEGDSAVLMHHTAAVHKAVKSAGFTINVHRSCFMPQPVFRVGNSSTRPECNLSWTTFLLKHLDSDNDVVMFTVDLFMQWLQDSYAWRCLPPIKVFPNTSSHAVGTLKEEKNNVLQRRRLDLFMKFFHVVLRPGLIPWRHHFPSLSHIVELELEDFQHPLTEQLESKCPLHGPQKWTTLDLRSTLSIAGAYAMSPVALFVTSDTAAGNRN